MSTKQTYWATEDTDKLLSDLTLRIDTYYKYLITTRRMANWRISYQYYYLSSFRGAQVVKTGEASEYTSVNVNHFRNLLDHLQTLIIGQRPSFEPRATNSDVSSQTQTILARGLLDYYMREKRLERFFKKAVEFATVFGEGYIHTDWDATMGEVYGIDPETNIEVREGDIEYTAFEPINVIRDVMLESYENSDWVILRHFVNKYDLMAKYPERADDIANVNWKYNPTTHYRFYVNELYDSDVIPVYIFYHRRTESMPDGRKVLFLNDSIALADTVLPFRNIPLHRMTASEISGTPFGDTVAFNLIPLQQWLDGLYSTVVTGQETFGVQNVMAPRGSNLNSVQLAGNLNFIEYDGSLGKPEALNLLATPPEIFSTINMLIRDMETLSGVNSVARGNPESSLKSGAALALVQSMSIQFSQSMQQSYVQLLEDVGTATIEILRDYASVPRVAMIVGKANRGMMREFTGKDLGQINRVMVDAGNPMTRTTAGKVNLAQMMIESGLVKTPEQLLQVIQTGNLDTLIEGETAELLQIKSENEKLVEGVLVPVVITDNHLLHISEHKYNLADPETRLDPEKLQATMMHIMEHVAILSDPANAPLLQLLGQPPIAPPQAATGEQAQLAPGAAPTVPPMNPMELVETNQPNMPNMPQVAQQTPSGPV